MWHGRRHKCASCSAATYSPRPELGRKAAMSKDKPRARSTARIEQVSPRVLRHARLAGSRRSSASPAASRNYVPARGKLRTRGVWQVQSERQYHARRQVPASRLEALSRLAGNDISIGCPLPGPGIIALRRRRHRLRPAFRRVTAEIRVARTRLHRRAGKDAAAHGEQQGGRADLPSRPRSPIRQIVASASAASAGPG